MQNVTHALSEIAFAIQTGATDHDLETRFNLTPDEVRLALEFYTAGNDLELVKLAQVKKILAPATIAEAPDAAQNEIAAAPVLPPPPPPTHGYVVESLGKNVFIRPLPKDHPGRLITPPAYQTDSDMGFIHKCGSAVSPELREGQLVLFDKFAEVGAHYDLVVDGGEIVQLVMVREEFILAKLKRVEL